MAKGYWSAHLYWYTRKSLQKLVNDSGEFEVVEKDKYNGIVVKLSNMIGKRRTGSSVWMN